MSSPSRGPGADWLLREVQSEERWSQLLADSQDALAQLADEALAEHRVGETEDLDLGDS